MKKNTGIIAYLLVCGLIISVAIYFGGKQHGYCRKCKLALGKSEFETSKFAEKWK